MEPGGTGKEELLTQLRRGVLEYCVLALLRDGEQYGVELARRLGAADALTTSEGTLYPLLSRLRRRGLVSTEWRESPAGPPRRYYRLTPDGQSTLASFSAEWATFRRAVDQLMEGE
ncbi:PadR family transcriptional regulator [Streptomyces justiciae]|uniref:PadR family transcriptional regulator n=1 Tax=Streptomyces justiciae TaxID=2780140 RepID=UPI002117DD75|nr:PadR family transcriptional regulator [Streptomyces justiciae]MCW8384642.1 PadR family transcriptional regulator [Streptomyces justiciae]